MHHVKLKRISRFTLRKGDLSCHHTMHHFHAITPILLLFDKSRPEKRVNHAITPCITLTPLRQLFCCFTYHVLKKWPITPSRQPLGGSAILAPILIYITQAEHTQIQFKMIEKQSCENDCSSWFS